MLIFVTGDKHGQLEPFLENSAFKKIKKNDILIVCGDFGFLWDKSNLEYKKLKWLSKRKYKIAFVDGCNDNMEIIEEYPVSVWNGGQVRLISDNIIYLMKGELYNIEDKKVLAFGGGFNSNLTADLDNNNWWPENYSTMASVDAVVRNIERVNGDFDLIVTHEAPSSITPCIEKIPSNNAINNILEEIRTHSKFNMWFFGKYHMDKMIAPKYCAIFDRVIKFDCAKDKSIG